MPLFVPVLRSAMLFMNIYDTYKTLKPPPPSTRDPTRPSVRAATQRKRDLKGVLAIWIVWCCFTLYERLIESFVNLFIPFYDEFKSMVILFLILTRARGAEPIFLHVLRPLMRPYDASIDGTLEVLRMTGDFVFALAAFPVQHAIGFVKSRFKLGFYLPQDDSDSSSDGTEAQDGTAQPSRSRQSTGNTVRTPARRTSGGGAQRSHLNGSAQAVVNGLVSHQIWHPSRSAYEDEDTIARTASNGSTGVIELTQGEKEVEEWRKYPDFPSAYPATPLATTTHLPPSTAAPAINLFAPIPEEGFMPPQDFHRSLKQPRKPLNPSYADDLSDQYTQTSGIHRFDGLSGTTSETAVETESESISDDDMSYDEEDSFDRTLRTPLHHNTILRSSLVTPRALPLSTFPSQSTAVDSVDTATSLQTRTISAPSSRSVSPKLSPADVDSDAEMEVELPAPEGNEMKAKLRHRSSSSTVVNRPALPRRGTVRASPLRKRKVARPQASEDSATASGTGTGDESGEAPKDSSGPDVYTPNDQKQLQPENKRPRVVPARKGATTSTVAKARATQTRVARRVSPTTPTLRAQMAHQTRGTRVQLTGTRGTRGTGTSSSSVKSQTGRQSRLETKSRAEGHKKIGALGDPGHGRSGGTEMRIQKEGQNQVPYGKASSTSDLIREGPNSQDNEAAGKPSTSTSDSRITPM